MKLGDKVVIKHPNPYYGEHWNEWQAWEIIELHKQATGIITRLKGLCVAGTEVIGYSPSELQILKLTNHRKHSRS